MVEKKSCDKHSKFHPDCEKCYEINKKFQEKREGKVSHPNAHKGADKGEEDESRRPRPLPISLDDDEEPPRGIRYKYKPFRNRPILRKYFIYIVIIVVAVVLISVFWLYPAWIADINLQGQLYNNKAEGLDYYQYRFLNFWNTTFFFNKTALIGAIIGTIIMLIPPDQIFLTLLGTKLRFGRPSRIKATVFWLTGGFGIFYLFGHFINSNGQFAWAIYLIERGELSIPPTILFDAFNVLLNPGVLDFTTIYVYSNVILPIISFIVGVLIFRMILLFIGNSYLKRNDYYLTASILGIVALIFISSFFTLPVSSLDGIQIIQSWAVIFGSFGFLGFSIFVYIYGKLKTSRAPRNYIMFDPEKKRLTVMAIGVIAMILTPLFISVPSLVNLNNPDFWTEQLWLKKYNREITWTRSSAGLDMFEERPIENYTSHSLIQNDAQMITQIRQYDQDFAVNYLAAKIGSTYEGLADSDIIYLNNKEYWVAPKTVVFSQITRDAVQTSTELYDHVEGILAMDTFTGELVDTKETFNVSANYPIFFGEKESEKFLEERYYFEDETDLENIQGGYDYDILLESGWAGKGEILKNNYTYQGSPDGTLTGIQAFWKTLDMGLISYATEPGEKKYLINRNIKKRVQNILLPNLQIDADPYLVFDYTKGKMYYAVSIYASIPISSYAKSPILRYLGVCLVDVLDGSMRFYKNPSLQETNQDPTYPLWKIYMKSYNWREIPNWLVGQLRYPENLFEQQLSENYIYHVQDPNTWKREDDFHERPAEGDLFYIETDLGEGIEYVGLDLVEYYGREARTLAGIYMVRHGSHFGEAIFYHTRGQIEKLIGPQTARDTYQSEATQEISLIQDARNGNTLIYPLGNSLYYYIPTYSTSGDLQQLKLAGFVEAFTRNVGYGANAIEAYDNLNITDTPTENVSLAYELSMESTMTLPDDLAKFVIELENQDEDYKKDALDVKLVLSLYTSKDNDVDYTLYLPSDYKSTPTNFDPGDNYDGENYTIVDQEFFFGQGLKITGYLEPSKGNIVIYYKWTLYVDGEIVNNPQETIILVLE
ncbi:MAG: conserved membrane protein of unknown function [Promethearchaeota archaeon]|nr:MAG: conserved membrane protein of unknown function [Candidatus Lokiarchaeota archaeon]